MSEPPSRHQSLLLLLTSDSSDRAGMGAGGGAFSSAAWGLDDPEALLKGDGLMRLTFSCTDLAC